MILSNFPIFFNLIPGLQIHKSKSDITAMSYRHLEFSLNPALLISGPL